VVVQEVRSGRIIATVGEDRDPARPVPAALHDQVVRRDALVASDPRLPFGGVKRPGYGRELSSLGVREFMAAKTVVVGS
jgi:succinate-semialdehyde dehydrogenase/glutarate-semialdehyde dehydrogenase